MTTFDELKAKAERCYDEARDQGKEMAIMTIASALIDVRAEGYGAALDEAERIVGTLDPEKLVDATTTTKQQNG